MNSAKIPTPVNEPVLSYAQARKPRARRAEAGAHETSAAVRSKSPSSLAGTEITHRQDGRCGDAALPSPRAGQGPSGGAGRGRRTPSRRPATAWREWSSVEPGRSRGVFLKAADLLATRWRAMVNARDDARPEQDGVSGGDRRGVRADRFLALQRPLRRTDSGRTAACRRRALWNALEYRGAGRLRLRDLAFQLHIDRRESLDGAGDHGRAPWCGSRRPRRRTRTTCCSV